MSWFSAIKRAVAAPVKMGLAPVKLTANIARHPTAIRSHLRAGIAAGLAPIRIAAATTKTSLRYSPHALIARKLRAAASRAPTTPFTRGSSGGGGGGGFAAGGYESSEDDEEMTDAPEDTGADDGGGDEGGDDGMSGIDYRAYLDGGRQLGDWSDDLQRIGVNLAKGAASGLLTSVGKSLTTAAPPPPPKPAGMSTTAKLAIGAAVGIPILFVLTRRKSAAPVAV